MVEWLNCCGPTVWRQAPLTLIISERHCWVVLWDCQICWQTSCIQTTNPCFFLTNITRCLQQRCSQPWSVFVKPLEVRDAPYLLF